MRRLEIGCGESVNASQAGHNDRHFNKRHGWIAKHEIDEATPAAFWSSGAEKLK
jgi:hypothetical protein